MSSPAHYNHTDCLVFSYADEPKNNEDAVDNITIAAEQNSTTMLEDTPIQTIIIVSSSAFLFLATISGIICLVACKKRHNSSMMQRNAPVTSPPDPDYASLSEVQRDHQTQSIANPFYASSSVCTTGLKVASEEKQEEQPRYCSAVTETETPFIKRTRSLESKSSPSVSRKLPSRSTTFREDRLTCSLQQGHSGSVPASTITKAGTLPPTLSWRDGSSRAAAYRASPRINAIKERLQRNISAVMPQPDLRENELVCSSNKTMANIKKL